MVSYESRSNEEKSAELTSDSYKDLVDNGDNSVGINGKLSI